ncbi:MAG: hypothetical protein SPE99_13805, partial [Blautia sp.]|nr:hypothetical protein [Blautia sp.]
EILEQIQRYVNKHKVEENISENVIQRQIEIDSRAGARWVKNWNKLINIENARELLKKEIQDMILKFKKELGIEYVSVNNIWDAELYLLQEKELYLAFNFNSLDSIIDFLVRNDLHPYINLDWTAMAAKEILHEKKEVHERFLREFLDHYYGIYGQIEVSHWIIGEVQRAGAEDKRYFNCFDTTWNKMRELSDSLAIVGGMDGEQSKEEFICYIREWKKSTQLPDYLVLKGIAFRNKNSGETVDKWGISYQNKDYLQEKLWAYRKTMDANGWAQVKIMISEWDFSDSDSNVLNDNIFKGAWIMRNAINSIGFADIMGYHSGMDRITRKASSDLLLSGQSGLLNHNGIGKPAYFAMRFLKEGKESLLMRDDNGMITTDNYGHFTILCHNYKHPNYHYFSMDESEVDNKDILHFFSD